LPVFSERELMFTFAICRSVVRYPRYSILIVDTYAAILVSPMSRYTAVYRSSTKYRETAQVSRVSSIPCNVHTTSL